MTGGKTACLVCICFSLLQGSVSALNCTSPTPDALFDALEKELFSRNLLRPVISFSDTLNISIDNIVVGIIGVNNKFPTLTNPLTQCMVWDIEGLSWDEKECGTTRVSVPREKLWIPDVFISEFMDEDNSPQSPYVYLYNTGRVYDDKPIRVVSSCQSEVYNFPFDIRNCSLTFGSYLHFAEEIRMIQSRTDAEVMEESRQVTLTKGEWELADIEAAQTTREKPDGSYSLIKYYVILRRRSTFYVVNLLIPSCFLVTMDLFSFMLPPDSAYRSSFKMTLILGYSIFLMMINNLLPALRKTPLINVFVSISFTLMVTSLLETMFIVNFQNRTSNKVTVPHWLRVLVLRYLAVAVCLPPKKKSNCIPVSLHSPATAMNTSTISSRDLQSDSGATPSVKPLLGLTLDKLRSMSRDLTAIRLQMHFQEKNNLQEWKLVGIVIDRLLFYLYIVFICLSFITITCIWINMRV
ncbi:5-hydroxytryptamine receptor 3A-like [Pseudoliparis swirei]|uniref:5-hydroxytryptamine receptor 3A-like n=1 Tax=Pseudoliparis swirei TaxID=2059687 RepID=UPI0024BE843F|nr:5-hydroxytryptamine receptor 3A-like [Pseudoliparis swirei]